MSVADMRRHVLSPALLCLVWFGAVAGVDLIAAPAPFSVSGLDRALALAVNRATFVNLNRLEWVLAGLTVVLLLWTRPPRGVVAAVGLAVAALAAQSLWLLPALSARTDLLLAGESLPPSAAHGLYAVMDVGKLISLLAAGWLGTPRITRPP